MSEKSSFGDQLTRLLISAKVTLRKCTRSSVRRLVLLDYLTNVRQASLQYILLIFILTIL